MLEWLKKILGDTYTEDIDKKISDEISKNFVSTTDFEALDDTNKQLEEVIKTRDAQIDELSKVDPKNLQATIEQLKADNAAAEKRYEEQLKQQKIDNAVTIALAGAKAKNIKAAKALLDLENVELQDDGTIKELKNKIDALKSAEDSKFLFEADEPVTFKGLEPGQGRGGLPGDTLPVGMTLETAIERAISATNNHI